MKAQYKSRGSIHTPNYRSKIQCLEALLTLDDNVINLMQRDEGFDEGEDDDKPGEMIVDDELAGEVERGPDGVDSNTTS